MSGTGRATTNVFDVQALRWLTFAGITVMLAIIAVHFGLINRGAWGGDEYTTFSHYKSGGLAYGWYRFWSWSPRPVSELLYGLYALAILKTRWSLVTPLFFFSWVAFLACAAPTFLNRKRDGMASHVLGTVALLAFVILGQKVFWVFYWPIGILAYMPVIAVAFYLLLSLINESARPQFESAGIVTMLVLVAGAWSSESGTLVVLVFAGMAIVYQIVRNRTGRSPVRIVVRWLPPIAAGLLVVGFSLFNDRTVDPMFPGGNPAVYHHTIASLFASAHRLPWELLSPAGEPTYHLFPGLIIRMLFFGGIYCCWVTRDPQARRDRHWLPVLALALVVEMFLEIAATYRQFGTPCCGHHVEVRYGLGLTAFAAIAIWLPAVPRVPLRILRALAPVLLVAAALPLFLPRSKDLALDYRYYWEPERLRAMTWDSGFSPGPSMNLYQPVPDSVFKPQIPPGHQVPSDGWWVPGILNLFGKQSVNVFIATRHGEWR